MLQDEIVNEAQKAILKTMIKDESLWKTEQSKERR